MPDTDSGPWKGSYFEGEHVDGADGLSRPILIALTAIAGPVIVVGEAYNLTKRLLCRFGDRGGGEASEK